MSVQIEPELDACDYKLFVYTVRSGHWLSVNLCSAKTHLCGQFFIIHLAIQFTFSCANINANVLAKQRWAERDRCRQIVAGLLQGTGVTSTFLLKAVWMLLNFRDAIKEGVVIIQGMGNEVEPDHIQALAAFNTGLSTVNELLGMDSFSFCTISVILLPPTFYPLFSFILLCFVLPLNPLFLSIVPNILIIKT